MTAHMWPAFSMSLNTHWVDKTRGQFFDKTAAVHLSRIWCDCFLPGRTHLETETAGSMLPLLNTQ